MTKGSELSSVAQDRLYDNAPLTLYPVGSILFWGQAVEPHRPSGISHKARVAYEAHLV